MLLLKNTLLFVALGTLTSCSKVNDFDLICGYFDKLVIENNKKKLSQEQKYHFINSLIKENISSASPAVESWNAVVGFLPAEGRYNLYKDAAEATLNTPWQCSSMRKSLKYF